MFRLGRRMNPTPGRARTRTRLAVPLVALGLIAMTSTLAAPQAMAGRTADVGSAIARDVKEARIEMAVHLAMLEKFGMDGLHVGVDVAGTKVTLTGEVGKRSTAELAEEVAKAVDGVSDVDNQLRLKPAANSTEKPAARALDKTEHEVGDAVLETRVKMKLLDQIGSNAFRIEVEATDGVVSLRGALASPDTRDVAIKTATGTSGVKRVIDLLTIRP